MTNVDMQFRPFKYNSADYADDGDNQKDALILADGSWVILQHRLIINESTATKWADVKIEDKTDE